MVYRKLHQNVATFRAYLDEKGRHYAGGKEKLAAKFVGRWRDGTPHRTFAGCPGPGPRRRTQTAIRNSPTAAISTAPAARIGAHIRRVNPRDAFGFYGQLVNRRRIMPPRPALRRLRARRPAGQRRRRPRHHFHGR